VAPAAVIAVNLAGQVKSAVEGELDLGLGIGLKLTPQTDWDVPRLLVLAVAMGTALRAKAVVCAMEEQFVPIGATLIFENMCRGIMKRGLLYGPQTDILTYEGCSTNSEVGQTYETRQQCDEYPFASTREGGSGAYIGCVPWWQNQWQGIYFSSWLSSVGLRNGDRFRVVLQGIDCTTVPQSDLEPPDVAGLAKRQSDGELVFTGSSANGTWLNQTMFGNLTSNEGRGAFVVPLPDLKAGVYNVPIQLNGGNISAMAAYDEDGEELARQNHTTTSATLSFTIEDDDVNVVAVAWASDKQVQLDYNARRSPLPSTSSSADTSQPTGTPSAGGSRLGVAQPVYLLTAI
ncbi:1539_t:CDS:2, partial [Acaulospora colombiana]